MHNVSETYKNASGYGFSLRLEAFINGTQERLTYDDLMSYKLSGNASSDELLSFGYVSANEISFSIDNLDGRWDNISLDRVVWTLFKGKMLSRDTEEVFQVGIFTTTEALADDGVINVKAIDNMSKFEIKFKGINFPCTINDLVLQCCKQAGVIFRSSTYPNMDFEITGAYQITQVTCRTIISLIAELAGCFAIINEYGELEFKWFNTQSSVETYNSDDITGFAPDTIENAIGGISISFNGTEYVVGTGAKKINLTADNRLLMYCTPAQIQEIITNIYSERQGLAYHTASFQSLGEPALELGDVITVVDRKGGSYKVLVSGLTFSGNLKMDVTSPPITSEDASTPSSSESGSIPRETAESVNTYVAQNDPESLSSNNEIDDFLYQKFSTETGAVPIAMITLAGACNREGILTVNVILDNTIYLTYRDTVRVGNYLNTILCPLQNIVSGNHSVGIQLISDSSLEISFQNEDSPTAGSVLIIQGRKMGQVTAWDGMIQASDNFKSPTIYRDDVNFKMSDVLNSALTNDSTGPIFAQTITLRINREDVSFNDFSENISTEF